MQPLPNETIRHLSCPQLNWLPSAPKPDPRCVTAERWDNWTCVVEQYIERNWHNGYGWGKTPDEAIEAARINLKHKFDMQYKVTKSSLPKSGFGGFL